MRLKLTLQLKTASAIWQKAVKSFSRLSELLIRATPLIVGGQSRGWVKAMFHFSRLVLRIKKAQGSRGLALFLKGNTLLIQRLVSGCRLQNAREAGPAVSVTNSGVPRWIPVIHRRAILGGDRAVISFYLGILTLYRVLNFKGRLSLSTVTDPGATLSPELLSEVSHFGREFVSLTNKNFGIRVAGRDPEREDPAFWGQTSGGLKTPLLLTSLTPKFKWMFTSGPNSKYSNVLAVGNAFADLYALYTRPHIFNMMAHARALTGASDLSWLPFFNDLKQIHKDRIAMEQERDRKSNRPVRKPEDFQGQLDLGALSIVEEPGKKRIVAMVDVWTQWLYYPLHLYIFDSILRFIPQDGTFDQLRPVKALLERAKEDKRTHFWSYDLSAATDRLPIAIQALVLEAFTMPAYAATWAELLTNRDYRTPKEFATTFGVSYVRYSVGQPMGAYSSWAMLALTHHFLVQLCAKRCGHSKWFTEYAVLGDDIVISDRGVADQYVRLMDELGVRIGFHKSIISNNSSLEFAKRFFLKGEEVSPLSLAGIAVGWLGPGFVPEILATCESKTGKEITLYQLARYVGVGFKAASAAGSRLLTKLPRILTSTFLLLLRPGAPRGVSSLLEWYTALTMSGSNSVKLKVANEEQIFDAIWKEVTDRDLTNALSRAQTVLEELFKPDNGKKILGSQSFRYLVTRTDLLINYREWFHDIIVPSFLRRFYPAIDHAGRVLSDAMKIWARERNLRKSLSLVEECFSILSLVPNRLSLVRREVEEGFIPSEMDVYRVLVPGSVRRWSKVASFTERKAPHMLKPRRKNRVSKEFLAYANKRMLRA